MLLCCGRMGNVVTDHTLDAPNMKSSDKVAYPGAKPLLEQGSISELQAIGIVTPGTRKSCSFRPASSSKVLFT